MPTKLKQMRGKVLEELKYIPKGPEPQNELRAMYWMMRMHSLGKKTKSRQNAKEVLENCINHLSKDYADFKFTYDNDLFKKSD